jgi:DUF4097 and DUF4098 domain-containing protein YvlB
MPTFDTPGPIAATIDLKDLAGGSVRINAGDRTDTVVEVRPSDPSDDTDVQTAEQTRVECSSGKLLVKAARAKGRWWLFEWGGSIDVTVDLPAGSQLDVTAAGDVHSTGRLGATRVSTASGEVWLDETGKLQVDSGDGEVSVTLSEGPADITTADGDIRIGRIDGAATVRTSNGDVIVGEVTGDLRARTAHGDVAIGRVGGDLRADTAHGDISVDRVASGVNARTAHGEIRIGEVVRGTVSLETSYGDLEVGIGEGTAAWLDVSTQDGMVRNTIATAEGPGPSDETVEIRARTSSGDIVLHRT